jgi:hypothetical protein
VSDGANSIVDSVESEGEIAPVPIVKPGQMTMDEPVKPVEPVEPVKPVEQVKPVEPIPKIPESVTRVGLTFEAASSGKLIAMDNMTLLGEIPGLSQSANLQKYFETLNRMYGYEKAKKVFTLMSNEFVEV